jgi:hypothetical protein
VEGGLTGIQKPNHNFGRFEQALSNGRHLFVADLERHFAMVRFLAVTPTVA